ncbi:MULTISPECIES: signal peptidase I [unclassified Frankia]|uniref:signal peptidase I n=2 Tax=Frankia TaxID=1854 RepID=UPI001EF48F2B|nr:MULTISPECIES: signal peptidase I [unclassified Frankia]
MANGQTVKRSGDASPGARDLAGSVAGNNAGEDTMISPADASGPVAGAEPAVAGDAPVTGGALGEPQAVAMDPIAEEPTRRARRALGRSRGGRGSFARELPVLILVAFLLALVIKAFLVQAFWIPTVSMERTLLVNDRVLVNKLVYRFRDVHRGEIVVFNGDGTGFERAETLIDPPSNVVSRAVRAVQGVFGLGAPSDKDFIKRVIGVAGDTVACCDSQGRVTVNDKPLDEPYVYENSPAGSGREFAPVKVPAGELWVMGDHRSESSDSRVNGTIPESKVVGRAFVRVWPLGRMAILSPPNIFATATGLPAASLPVAGLAAAGVVAVGGVAVSHRRSPLGRSSPGGDGGSARHGDRPERRSDRPARRRRRQRPTQPPTAVRSGQGDDPA